MSEKASWEQVDLDAPTPEQLAKQSRRVLVVDRNPGRLSEVECGFAPKPIRIVVHTLTNLRLEVDVRGVDTVRSLRDRVASRRNFDGTGPDALAVTRLLQPHLAECDAATANQESSWMSDERTLDSYGVVAGCCVRLHRWAPPVSYLPATERLAICTDLDMQRRAIGDAGCAEVAAALRDQACDFSRAPCLRALRLGLNQLTEVGARALSAALLDARLLRGVAAPLTLATLDLRYNAIGDAGAQCIAEACVRGNSSLTHLDLTRCAISNAGARALGLALTGASVGSAAAARRTLFNQTGECNDVDSNGTAADIATDAAEAVFGAPPALRTLLLGQNTIGDVGALVFAAAFGVRVPTTVHIDAASDAATVDAAAAADQEAAAQALRPLARLAALDLHANRCTDNVVFAFVRALEVPGCVLTDLNLSDNRCTDRAAAALARILQPHAPSLSSTSSTFASSSSTSRVADLRTLGLGSLITDQGALALARALKANRTLTNLRLVGCRIGDAGATAFAELLTPRAAHVPPRVSMQSEFSRAWVLTPTEQASAAAMHAQHVRNATNSNYVSREAAACAGNDTLTGLNLCDNLFGAATVRRFAQTLESNTDLIALGLGTENPSLSSLSLSSAFVAPLSPSAALLTGGHGTTQFTRTFSLASHASTGAHASPKSALRTAGASISATHSPSTSLSSSLSSPVADAEAAAAIADVLERNTTLTWYRGPGGRRG